MNKVIPAIILCMAVAIAYSQFTPTSSVTTQGAVMRNATDWKAVSNDAVTAAATIDSYAIDPQTLQDQIDALAARVTALEVFHP